MALAGGAHTFAMFVWVSFRFYRESASDPETLKAMLGNALMFWGTGLCFALF